MEVKIVIYLCIYRIKLVITLIFRKCLPIYGAFATFTQFRTNRNKI